VTTKPTAEREREPEAAPKRKPRSKEERAADLLREAKIDRAVKSARTQLDVIRKKLYERDFDGAVAMAKELSAQMTAELPFNELQAEREGV
jgi:hypothetical protein